MYINNQEKQKHYFPYYKSIGVYLEAELLNSMTSISCKSLYLNAHGQLSLLSMVQSGRNLNKSKIICIPLIVIGKFKKDLINNNREKVDV